MVAETCSGNWIKDAMVCSSKSRFLGKILVALKKLFSSTIFPDFRYMHTVTWFSGEYCTFYLENRSPNEIKIINPQQAVSP